MVLRRGCYKKEDLEEALTRTCEGEKFAAVARTSPIPIRTLFKKSKELQTTGSIEGERRGPKPALSPEQEADIVAWVAGMQRAGFPVGPARVLDRANKIYAKLPTELRPKIVSVRNSVDADPVRDLSHAMAKTVVQLQLSADRVFNMDETAFMSKGTSRRVLALKGSTNVWSKETQANFHMPGVAAVNAAGVAIPPLIILPGKRIYNRVKTAITTKGA
ncbi:hypothetical protein PF005_g8226 [Phytophthora fragariae]|uniref:HTH CENPB-type domain-containing protein n=2 Tax=Phytophthora fragariae TaxID=53985 RepID=A0A6A3YIH5_9STRA|nr:hypothetical protein PF005_g8226 [Phytophthora fragariae]